MTFILPLRVHSFLDLLASTLINGRGVPDRTAEERGTRPGGSLELGQERLV
jgi:hypothetical protein